MAIEIAATGACVPADSVSNAELVRRLKDRIETSDEWIISHTGIKSRFLAKDETASVLAARAAQDAIDSLSQKTGESAVSVLQSIDLIITATASPDFAGFPSVSCLVQNALGIKGAAFDVSAACSGFVYALECAAGLMERSVFKRALVIGAETTSRYTNWDDRSTCVLFGDGAGAVVLEKTEAPSSGADARGIAASVLKADGAGWDALVNYGEPSCGKRGIVMDGRRVYNFAVASIVDIVQTLLEKAGGVFGKSLTPDSLAFIVPHQANSRIIEAAAKRLGVNETKFVLNIDKYANTVAASIPIALNELERQQKLKRGSLVLLAGFGAGLTYGGNLIVW